MSGRVVVVGAGIAGLTTAYRLLGRSDDLDVVVLESSGRTGGKVLSAEVGGIELEAGPDSVLARKPWAVELCRELDMGDDLVPAATRATHVWSERGLIRFPSGPFGISADPRELWRWPGMSRAGKLRAAADLVRRGRSEEADESLGSLLRRRIGDEATDALVAPLLGGLFAGDVDRLSVRATFPELGGWERRYGSLIRGARAAQRAARAHPPSPMFVRLRGGLRRLPEALGRAIGEGRIRLGTAARSLRGREGGGYVVATDGGDLEAEAVVVTSPVTVTAGLVRDLAPRAADGLQRIQSVSTAVVLLVYPEGTGPVLPESSGFVVPRGRLAMTAATLVSRKWPDEAFGTRAIVRCFAGGAGVEEVVDEPDADIVEGVSRQLAALLPLPDAPESSALVRWPQAMPQYEVGHLELVERIEAALPPGVFVAGQAFRGAGIPDCVRQGNEAAARAWSFLSSGSSGRVEGERVR